jgi:hypothetical protein
MRIFVRKHYHPLAAFLMMPAIAAAKGLARMRILFLRPQKEIGSRVRLMIYSVGNTEQWNDFKKLTVRSDLLLESLSCMDMEKAGIHLDESREKISDKALLFNTGPIQIKEIVELIGKYPGRMHYLFRIYGSDAVVGSHRRTQHGIVIHG